QMELTPVYADEAKQEPAVVRINSAQESAIGFRTEVAREQTGSAEVRTVGRVQAQESRIYQVSAATDGWIRQVRGGESGAFVSKGEALAPYTSPDPASPQQGYLYAVESLQRISASNKTPKEQFGLAEKQIEQARDTLASLGLSEGQISELKQ